MHAYERFTLRRYLANALRTRRLAKPPSRKHDLCTWVREDRRKLGLPVLRFPPNDREDMEDKAFARCWQEWRVAAMAALGTPPTEKSAVQKRLDWLAEACRLNGSQAFLLGLFARLACEDVYQKLIAAINDELNCSSQFYQISEIESVFDRAINRNDLKESAALQRMGLLTKEGDYGLRASDLVMSIMRCKRHDRHHLSEILLGAPQPATLAWEDFGHLNELRDLAARLLSAATAPKASGGPTNILFYGPPGTGKSEFAKTLATQIGCHVRFIGESDERSAEPNRRERVAALILANALGYVAERLVLVVDEADDLFAGVDEDNASTRHGSKVFMNRLVETTKVPTIWITNDLSRLGAAVVRRMNLIIGFPQPGLQTRRKMVERIAERIDFRLDDAAVTQLAHLRASPALLETAIAATARIEGSAADTLAILRSGTKAMGTEQTLIVPAPLAFDPALSSTDVDLLDLADRVGRAKTTALSFCLSGPPGTGKSAYARYLAERLGMEVLDKRYSDLISAYVGDSEKAIARAFEEAADQKAFLILDEADSLLRDRGAARHSWEITQVNEMLCAMERHPYPFACTTNAPEFLDQATTRRFLFKVRFLPMSEQQIALAFRQCFGMDCPEFLIKLDALTPGDFAVVARKAAALGERDIGQIARWVAEEAHAKPEARKVRIGF